MYRCRRSEGASARFFDHQHLGRRTGRPKARRDWTMMPPASPTSHHPGHDQRACACQMICAGLRRRGTGAGIGSLDRVDLRESVHCGSCCGRQLSGHRGRFARAVEMGRAQRARIVATEGQPGDGGLEIGDQVGDRGEPGPRPTRRPCRPVISSRPTVWLSMARGISACHSPRSCVSSSARSQRA